MARTDGNNLTMIQAITQGLDQELEANDKVLVFGEDVGKNGGVFRATEGLQEKYGEDRVMDTPLAESAIGGMSIGLALQGYRPVMEIQFFGFVFEVMDSIAGQMSRTSYRTGGQRGMPIVVRSPMGGGVYAAEMHQDSLEGLMAQVPGVKVVIPSTPTDAKGLITAAIRDEDPVIFLEHMKLYRSFREKVPEEQYEVEIGKAKIVQEGTDVSLVGYGAMVHEAKEAADRLAEEGISAEVIDLRTVSPIDYETVGESIKKTGRLVYVQEAPRQSGVGGKFIGEVSLRFILNLVSPIEYVSPPDTIYPFGELEDDWLPDADDIFEAAKRSVEYDH